MPLLEAIFASLVKCCQLYFKDICIGSIEQYNRNSLSTTVVYDRDEVPVYYHGPHQLCIYRWRAAILS